MVLFGVLGDLARRKLLVSLYNLEKERQLSESTRIIGVDKDKLSQEEFKSSVLDALNCFENNLTEEHVLLRFLDRLSYFDMDLSDRNSYSKLSGFMDNKNHFPVYYLSTPSAIYGDVCGGLFGANLIVENARIVLEKPIGKSLKTSRLVNNVVKEYFTEKQIYRIDHYLGKDAVLNLMTLRFANPLFISNWDSNHIESIDIFATESVGIEGRWNYYDKTGHLKDMMQNHVLQLLALIAMEPPTSLNADDIRDEKVKVLKSLRPINKANIEKNAFRGQYTDGVVDGNAVPGYRNEKKANTISNTETCVLINANIDNWRWSGVPFRLYTGKRLMEKSTRIEIRFKPLAHNIFKPYSKVVPSNKLVINLQPSEGIEIQLMNKPINLEKSVDLIETSLKLGFRGNVNTKRMPDAYERLLLEVIRGNQSLFVRQDEVEAAWSWIDDIIQGWKESNTTLKSYPAGTMGLIN